MDPPKDVSLASQIAEPQNIKGLKWTLKPSSPNPLCHGLGNLPLGQVGQGPIHTYKLGREVVESSAKKNTTENFLKCMDSSI